MHVNYVPDGISELPPPFNNVRMVRSVWKHSTNASFFALDGNYEVIAQITGDTYDALILKGYMVRADSNIFQDSISEWRIF